MRLARDFDFQLKVDRTSDQELKWQRRRNRRGMLAPKTSPVKTNNVETYYHLPIPENVVKASLADPLVTPLLLRKKVKLDPCPPAPSLSQCLSAPSSVAREALYSKTHNSL